MHPSFDNCTSLCITLRMKHVSAIFIVLTISFGLLLVLNILITYIFLKESISGVFAKELVEYPFPCDDLSLSPVEDEDTFDISNKLYKLFLHENRYICSYWNLTNPLQKFIERKSRLRLASGLGEARYLQCGNESLRKPSGYLNAAFRKLSPHKTYEGGDSSQVLHWDERPENSFISENLHYHNGKISVREGRFYFLYSSVLINLSHVEANFGKMYRFILNICADRLGYERILLHRSHIYNPITESATSLTVGGHVYIAKGDTVYVKVSGASRLIRNSFGNTFGILPLRRL